MLSERGIVPHAELPKELRSSVSVEVHALIAVRIGQVVRREFAVQP